MMGTGKYGPLFRYLQGVPLSKKVVWLTMDEIEGIIGLPLPPTARTEGVFWQNLDLTKNPQRSKRSEAWQLAGFKAKEQVWKGRVKFFRAAIKM